MKTINIIDMTIYLSLLKSVVGPAALSEGQDVGLVHLLPTPLDLKGQRRSPPQQLLRLMLTFLHMTQLIPNSLTKAMPVHFHLES